MGLYLGYKVHAMDGSLDQTVFGRYHPPVLYDIAHIMCIFRTNADASGIEHRILIV